MNNYPIFNCWFCNGATKFAGLEGLISIDPSQPILFNRECFKCNTAYCVKLDQLNQQFEVYYIDITYICSVADKMACHIKCRALNGTAFLEYHNNPRDSWARAQWTRIDLPQYCFNYLTLEEILNKVKTYILFS